MKKFFVKVLYKSCKKLVKVLYEDEMTSAALITAITKSFNLNQNPKMTTNDGLEIDEEDVLDYVNQYASNTDFILYIEDTEKETECGNFSTPTSNCVIPTTSDIQNHNSNNKENCFITTKNQVEIGNLLCNDEGRYMLTSTNSGIETQNILSDATNVLLTPTSSKTSFANTTLSNNLNLADSCLMLQMFSTLNTKEELEQFFECHLKYIIKSYTNKKCLTNFERITLSKTIIKHILDIDPTKTFLRSQFESLATNIVEIFPNEKESTYFKKFCGGKVASGKLWDAYNNYRTQLAKAGVIVRRTRANSRSPCSSRSNISPQSSVLDLDDPENVSSKDDLIALESLTAGDQLSRKWENTFELRKGLLQTEISSSDYIKRFPALEQAEGYKLFNIDVELLYGKKPIFLISDQHFEAILKQGEKNSHKRVKEILRLVSEETSDNNKRILSLMILAYLLPNTNLKKPKKNQTKPSKIEVQESFICHYKNLLEADDAHREFLKKSGGCIQPRLVLIGTPIQTSVVHVAHMKYTYDNENIKESLETCMSVFLAMNLQYPHESTKVWYYIQKYIFQINTPYDFSDTATETLFNDLTAANL